MSIKQLGGVFGRNPTFNDVTIEGQLTFDGDIDVSSDLKVDGDLNVTGITTLEGNTFIDSAGSVNMILTGGDGNSKNIYFRKATGPTQQALIQTIGDDLRFFTGPSEAARFNSSGNLAFPSGQGIDFSATSGTGTSELFDDYEEGTWTPTIAGQSSGGTGTYTSQSGGYRKIGGMVQAWFQVGISAHTGSGVIDIEGFPFSSANDSLAQIGTAATLDMTFTADGTPIIRMSANSAKAQLQTVSSGSNWTSQSLATDTVFTIYGSISYKTS